MSFRPRVNPVYGGQWISMISDSCRISGGIDKTILTHVFQESAADSECKAEA